MNERARHELYEWLRTEAGVDNADTFMEPVPPTGWGDVATRRDLDLLRAEVRAEIAELRADLSEKMRTQTLTLSTLFVAVMGLSVALNQFLS